jgi:hypothetical protein
LVEAPSRAETWGPSGDVHALDDHQVSAPLDAGAKAEVATSKNRSFDRAIRCDKTLAWDGRLSHLVVASSRAETWRSSGDVHMLDDHQVSAPLDAGAKAEVATSKNGSFDRAICHGKTLAWDEQLSHLVKACSEA